MEPVKTLVVDNFSGSMTSFLNGNINSGLAAVVDTFGNDPFSYPGRLTWNEESEQIDSAGAVITDLIVAGKARLESGITYVYAIGHTGRVYKIQVNDPTTYDPNYDNPVLLATLAINSPTFTRGGFIEFYGTTEKIYIGHDKGLTSIDFDGTGEAFVGVLGSWTQNVPRPLQQFIGQLCIGNGENIAIVDETATVTSYARLSPAFPRGTQVRDLDVTPDGTYLISTVTRSALFDITVTTPQTNLLLNPGSFVFQWNGIDTGYTNFTSYPNASLSANIIFGDKNYLLGYDTLGGALFDPLQKLNGSFIGSTFSEPPLPNAVVSTDNFVGWATPLPYEGNLEMTYCTFGGFDYEIGPGFYAPFARDATGTETDVIRIPYFQYVSNFAQGLATNGYTNGIFGVPKIYFSTLETSDSTTKYKLYRWSPTQTGLGVPVVGGIYQTQTQLFSKKVQIKEVRIYADPWVANNAFTVELIGSGGVPMTNGAKSFVAGTNLTVGDDFAWWNPEVENTYALGIRVTTEGTANFIINKIEIDYAIGGK